MDGNGAVVVDGGKHVHKSHDSPVRAIGDDPHDAACALPVRDPSVMAATKDVEAESDDVHHGASGTDQARDQKVRRHSFG